MKRFSIKAALAAIVLTCGPVALAAPNAVVEAVQSPAWVERDGAKIPLQPGMELKDHDQLRTGANSRLLLKTADGSAVKLGENGALALDSMEMRKDNVYQAAMKVTEGAFRFTTTALAAKYRGKREVNITVATVTAGIRGTDLWGKAASDRDIVCLIEGKIEVQRGQDRPVTMDQPMSFYIAPKNQPPLPVAPVSRQQLDQWALETETQAGKGVSKQAANGRSRQPPVDTPGRGIQGLRPAARRRLRRRDPAGEGAGQARLQRAPVELRQQRGRRVRRDGAEAR